MSPNFEEIQKMNKDQMQAASAAASSVANNLKTLASEAGEYSKKVFESNSAFVEKLLGVKSIESAIQLQTEYAKSSYESFVAQTSKIGDIYGAMVKDAMRPLEGAANKIQATA